MKGFEIIVKDELFKHFKGLALGADNIVKDPTNNGYWVNATKQPIPGKELICDMTIS